MKETLNKYKGLIILVAILIVSALGLLFANVYTQKENIQKQNETAKINKEYLSDVKSKELSPNEKDLNMEGYSYSVLLTKDKKHLSKDLTKEKLESAVKNRANYLRYGVEGKKEPVLIPDASMLKAIDLWNEKYPDDKVDYQKLVGIGK